MTSSPRQETLEQAKAIVESSKTGALAVLDPESGGPYNALVNYGLDDNGQPTFLLSMMARHTQALTQDPRASLLVADRLPEKGDPLVTCRATLMGKAYKVAREVVGSRYLQSHPYAATYVEFGDFDFWTLQVEQLYVVAGFGRIFRFTPDEYFGSSAP